MSRNLAKPGKSDCTWVTLNMLLSEEIKEGQMGGGLWNHKKSSLRRSHWVLPKSTEGLLRERKEQGRQSNKAAPTVVKLSMPECTLLNSLKSGFLVTENRSQSPRKEFLLGSELGRETTKKHWLICLCQTQQSPRQPIRDSREPARESFE